MLTIGFYGQVDTAYVDQLEKENKIDFIHAHRKYVYAGLAYLREQLSQFNVTCDWEAGYEDGRIEFLIDYEPEVDIEPVKKAITNLNGLVKLLNFF